MRVKIRLSALITFCAASFILNAFSGLAGPLSSFLSVLLPALFISSIVHLFVSWKCFAFHQNFSNDHPQKGEIVRYSLIMTNEGVFPLASGVCNFADPGPASAFAKELAVPDRGGASQRHDAEIRCSYRGTYVIGLSSFSFRDMTGIVEIEEQIEPRIFYVYPELTRLDGGIEWLARSSGFDRPGSDAREEDPTIFEHLSPLIPGRPARRIAWKRWAATGIPADTVYGQARSSALTVVLDLWPGYFPGTEKLASEDMAMSAAFSVLQYLARERIPAELIYGGAERGMEIPSPERFTEIFDQTTNVIFNDERFPTAAFTPDKTALLVTTRPLIDARKNSSLDLFTAFENGFARGGVPHLLICPPPERVDEERRILQTLVDRQSSLGIKGLLALADPRRGMEDIAHALRF